MKWRIERTGDGSRFVISGKITAESDFASLLAACSETLVLDIGDVSMIDSGGAREWVVFAAEVDRGGKSLQLERCPPIMVRLVDTIARFLPKRTRIASVVVPYCCSTCDHAELRNVPLENGQAAVLETDVCAACSTPTLIFDDLPESYVQVGIYVQDAVDSRVH